MQSTSHRSFLLARLWSRSFLFHSVVGRWQDARSRSLVKSFNAMVLPPCAFVCKVRPSIHQKSLIQRLRSPIPALHKRLSREIPKDIPFAHASLRHCQRSLGPRKACMTPGGGTFCTSHPRISASGSRIVPDGRCFPAPRFSTCVRGSLLGCGLHAASIPSTSRAKRGIDRAVPFREDCRTNAGNSISLWVSWPHPHVSFSA